MLWELILEWGGFSPFSSSAGNIIFERCLRLRVFSRTHEILSFLRPTILRRWCSRLKSSYFVEKLSPLFLCGFVIFYHFLAVSSFLWSDYFHSAYFSGCSTIFNIFRVFSRLFWLLSGLVTIVIIYSLLALFGHFYHFLCIFAYICPFLSSFCYFHERSVSSDLSVIFVNSNFCTVWAVSADIFSLL